MASSVDTQSFEARNNFEPIHHDPGAATEKLSSEDGGTTLHGVDMRETHEFIASITPSVVGGNGVTLFRIMAYSDAALTADGTEVKTTGAIQLDALTDYAVLSCTDQEVQALGATLRYVSGAATMATNTDEAKIIHNAVLKYKSLDSTTAVQQA